MDIYRFDQFLKLFFLNVFSFYFIYTLESKCHYYYRQYLHCFHFYFVHLMLLFVLAIIMFLLVFPSLPLIIFVGVIFTLICEKIYVVELGFKELMCYSKNLLSWTVYESSDNLKWIFNQCRQQDFRFIKIISKILYSNQVPIHK